MVLKITGPTMKDLYEPVTSITEQEEADQYFELLVALQLGFLWKGAKKPVNFAVLRQEAENMVKSNIGYYAGYFNAATRNRINHLFKVTHPIFGG